MEIFISERVNNGLFNRKRILIQRQKITTFRKYMGVFRKCSSNKGLGDNGEEF
jgi:hypothetical protein